MNNEISLLTSHFSEFMREIAMSVLWMNHNFEMDLFNESVGLGPKTGLKDLFINWCFGSCKC